MARKYHDRDWLHCEYVEKERSSVEIARDVGVSKGTILNWLNRHSIPTRKRGPQKGAEFSDTSKLKDPDWLENQYVEMEKSTNKIASEQGVGQQTVLNWLDKHGIETRDKGDVLRECSSSKDGRLTDESWLRQKYNSEGMTMADIARECDVTTPAIKYWLDRHGIERRNDGAHGLEGDSIFQRDPNWEEKRQQRLEIDNYECQDCGVSEDEYYRSLDVHHKEKKEQFIQEDGSINWEDANAMEILVSLCQSCHMKRHHEKEG